MSAEIHGKTNTKEYRTWENMKKRCHTVTDPHYPRWGGRGIFVCDRWRKSFIAFFNDMGEAPSPDHTIERINNNGPYSPENCRWAHKSEQAANSRKNVFLTYNGETRTVSEWARKIGLPQSALGARIRAGWPVEDALTIPSDPGNKLRGTKIEYLGRVQSVTAWAREFGVRKLMVFRRLAKGMTIHEALTLPKRTRKR